MSLIPDSTIKLTEDLISFEKIDVNPSNHPTSIYRVVLGVNKIWSKEEAEQIKHHILKNQNIVERLKEEYESTKYLNNEGNYFILTGREYEHILQSILNPKESS